MTTIFCSPNMNFKTEYILSIGTFLYVSSLSLAQLEEWKIPCGSIYRPKNCENATLKTLLEIKDFERCAPALLKTVLREYVWGANGMETTFRDNNAAFDRLKIRGRRLRHLPDYSLETTVFGRRVAAPIGISHTAGQTYYHKEGELGMAKGAARAGVVNSLTIYSNFLLEDIAEAVLPEAEQWMHVYIFPNRTVTVDIVRRAERAGYKAIVVTVDELYTSDIRCNARSHFFKNVQNINESPNLISHRLNDTSRILGLSLNDLNWLTSLTYLPVVVKGILTAEDALAAIDAGAKAIFVSNQGGRELDDALPTIDALVPIARVVKTYHPDIHVFVDGGVRSGHDVFKALARGADIVFIGRPAIWGLTFAGSRGVERVVEILKKGFKNALLHAGYSKPSEIEPSSIISKWDYKDFH